MNRAMVLTPAGVGAIAVVRIVGPGVGAFLRDHFSREAKAGVCAYGEVRDGVRVIDDAVVVLGEDGASADVNVHGGAWVVRDVMALLRRAGFEVQKWDAGALWAADGKNPLEREVQAWLPMARTELGIKVLLAQEAAWRRLVEGASTESAGAREPGIDPEALRRILLDRTLVNLLVPPRVAIVGVPNVGKSTLANQLFAQERSITADLPGTTRDWVGELANVDGLVVQLVDTPGVREAEDPIERAAIEQSRRVVESAELVLVVLDPTRELAGAQQDLLGQFPDAVRVVNKADAVGKWDAEWVRGIRTVATNGEGIDAVRRAIRVRFEVEAVEPDRPRWWTERQREALLAAVEGRGPIRAVVEG